MYNIPFTQRLIKGKIAELIFAQMVRSIPDHTILAFGYENTLPSLAQMHPKNQSTEKTIEVIKTAPDFTIINHSKNEVHLVEVKYMGTITKSKVMSASKKIQKSWKKAALFVASPDGFYFDTVEDIIKNKGVISEFKHPKIKPKTQAQYLELLNEFIAVK
jgi:Holliday junction resolvase-like predicted endonuclease